MDILPQRNDDIILENTRADEFDAQMSNAGKQIQAYKEENMRLEAQLKRYQSLIPNDDFLHQVPTGLVDVNKDVIQDYRTFIMNSPIMQAYEQHIG